MKTYKVPMTAAEIRTSLENDLLQFKAIMYAMLAFFLGSQAIVSLLVAACLLIVLAVSIMFLLAIRDTELWKVLLHYELPKIFPAP